MVAACVSATVILLKLIAKKRVTHPRQYLAVAIIGFLIAGFRRKFVKLVTVVLGKTTEMPDSPFRSNVSDGFLSILGGEQGSANSIKPD